MSSPISFTHLHVHSQYSLLKGAIAIENLVHRTKELGMHSVAITDHANLFGAIEFYEKCKSYGIHPILGSEIYYLPTGSCLEKQPRFRERDLAHLVLIAQNQTGYKNLCRLLSIAYLKGFYYKPRLDRVLLAEYSEGIIALSGCARGEISRKLIEGKIESAIESAELLAETFPQRFYLELSDHGLAHEKMVNDELLSIARQKGLPLVVTNNVHYLMREDREAHEALLCIDSGHKLKQEDRPSYEGEEFYLKSPEEMTALFAAYPEALENTERIAKDCHVEFDFKNYYFPKFEVPAGADSAPFTSTLLALAEIGESGGETLELNRFFIRQIEQGFLDRWPLIWKLYALQESPSPDGFEESIRQQYRARLEFELKTILSMGFASYFLVVADFIGHAKSKGIPVGPGRGSAAGSLVAYCLKITDLDPIPYHLLFERFLNPERISMPDMDIDFCMNRRDEVIAYVNQKYGNVAQIITYGKMKAKAVIRDVGRVLDLPYAEVDKIAKLIPNTLNITLKEALEAEPRLKELENGQREVRQLLKIARSLEGLTRHASTHAAGVVISDRPLTEFLPLYRGSKEEVVTQFDMKGVEKIGLVKFDFLGLKTLTVIENALKIISKTRGLTLQIEEILLDDAAVYERLSLGDGLGVFQLESSGMRELMTKLKPGNFEDIVALVALYRPGPLGSGMVDDFINRKHGRTAIAYELPELEPILKDTYGVIVYQEQVMQIASALASYSLGEADLLRRAMGKKKPEEMAKQRERFVGGALKNKISEKIAEKIFDLMAKFAEYGFNKSHSAAYALVSYQTAYLKTHYTACYMASLLTHEMGDTDKILTYIHDLQTFGIKVLPPDVNESQQYFSVLSDKKIRFGLAAVKNIGEAAIDSILETRKRVGSFESLFHFCEEVDSRKVNKKVIESLIQAGAFDRLDIKRSQAMAVLEPAMTHAAGKQRDRETGQSSLFDRVSQTLSRPQIPEMEEWPEFEKLKKEKDLLGFYLSSHPLKSYAELFGEQSVILSNQLLEFEDQGEVCVAGMMTSFKEITTKKGKRMGFLTLEDLQGSFEVVVFADVYERYRYCLSEDEPLVMTGEVDVDEDTPKLIVKTITPLQKMKWFSAKPVHLEISKNALDEKKLKILRYVFEKFKGNAPVFLHVTGDSSSNEKTTLRLGEELSVEASAAFKLELKEYFGDELKVLPNL